MMATLIYLSQVVIGIALLALIVFTTLSILWTLAWIDKKEERITKKFKVACITSGVILFLSMFVPNKETILYMYIATDGVDNVERLLEILESIK